MNKDILKMYTDPIPEQSDYAVPKKKKKSKKKQKAAPVKVKAFGGIKVMDMDVHVESKARDSDSSSDEAPVVEVDVEDEEHYAYAMRMKRAKERNASRWRELDLDGRVIVKVEDDADLSPPRGGNGRDDADLSPPRGSRGDDLFLRGVKREPGTEEADISPPRPRRGRDADISPPRIKREPGTEDLSPPRGRGADVSPPRRPHGEDMSPPRRRDADVDMSPPRRRDTDADMSPPRRRDTDADMSPPRRRDTDADMSPPRRANAGDLSPKRKTEDKDLSPARKKFRAMSTGGRAGLFLGDEVAKEEEEMKKKQKEELRKMDPKASGQGAATIFRDRRGKVLSGLTQMIAQEEGKLFEDASTNFDWGVGRIDKEKEEKMKKLEEEEAGRGFHATYFDDERLNKEKMVEDRWDDPMAKLVSKPSSNKNAEPEKLLRLKVYRGRLWSNRYNIRPGWRWDGIDRSNKFEDRMFHMLNEKNAQHVREMHFSQADM